MTRTTWVQYRDTLLEKHQGNSTLHIIFEIALKSHSMRIVQFGQNLQATCFHDNLLTIIMYSMKEVIFGVVFPSKNESRMIQC